MITKEKSSKELTKILFEEVKLLEKVGAKLEHKRNLLAETDDPERIVRYAKYLEKFKIQGGKLTEKIKERIDNRKKLIEEMVESLTLTLSQNFQTEIKIQEFIQTGKSSSFHGKIKIFF